MSDHVTDYLRARALTEQNAIIKTLCEWAADYHEDGWNAAECLEAIDCAGCHAPGALIYNQDIANHYAIWWAEIDDAMLTYHEETDTRFAPETTGQLVWFAVEWWAYRLASDVRYNCDGEG